MTNTEQEPIEGEEDATYREPNLRLIQGNEGEEGVEAVGNPETLERDNADRDKEAARDALKGEIARSHELSVEARWVAKSVEAARAAAGEGGRTAEQILAESLEVEFSRNGRLPEGNSLDFETLATEIIQIDSELVLNLKNEISNAYQESESKPTPEQIDQVVESVRTGFYGALIAGSMSANSIRNLVGQIKFVREGEDVGAADKKDVCAAYGIVAGQGVFKIYDQMIRGENGQDIRPDVQTYLVTHEIGHGVELSDLYRQETFDKLIYHAGCIDSDYIELEAETPELAEIVRIVRSPEESAGLHNFQIENYLARLAEMPEGTEKGNLRQFVAQELIADQIAASLHLRRGENSENNDLLYLESRLHFVNHEKMMKFLSRVTGCETAEQIQKFYAEQNLVIDPKTMSPAIIIKTLATLPKFATLLKTNHLWAEALNQNLMREKELKLRPLDHDFETEEALSLDQFGGYYESPGSYSGGAGGAGGASGAESSSHGSSGAGEEAVNKIIDFFTGTKT